MKPSNGRRAPAPPVLQEPLLPPAEDTAAGGNSAAGPDRPLAVRLRPRTLDELAGQAHLMGPGGPLRRAIEQDRLGSMILWGPPGTGKSVVPSPPGGVGR